MDGKYIFWFTFLVVQASCEQKKSLTFVIDNSWSMTDDINYVRNASKSIIDIVLNEKSSQIEDIVLVTFNDPTWEFRKRTRNEVELKKALDDITVIRNWDCPENCLSGINMGLEESLPGSFLYVFTDASAKDYRMFEQIKNLCQEKQIQIVFVLTGDCGWLSGPGSQVYYKIAAASNGQVFRVSKENVGEVLEYVRETIKGDRTVITSTVVHPSVGSDSYVYFNIDDKTEYALMSASGSKVGLKVSKDGTELPGIKVTWTANVKVLKLVGIAPGLYRAAVRGTSDVNVMVFGRTDFNFKFGFSSNKQNSLKYTEQQPTIGSETHLIISVKDDEHSVDIENVELLDMNERVIRRLPLTNMGSNVYSTEKFLPPNVMFKVAVTATARSTRNPIRRIANTPVEPIKPLIVPPEITDTEKYIEAIEDSKVTIHCRIRKGKPKPHVTWYFRQRGAEQFTLLSGRTDEELTMSNVGEGDSGAYQCVAENIAGRAAHVVQLEVFVKPEFEDARNITLVEHQNLPVALKCKLRKGNPRPGITWYFRASGSAEFTTLRNSGEELRLPAVQLQDSGEYRCVAENGAGRDERTMLVTVLVQPEITDTKNYIQANEDSRVTIHCRIREGNPKPHVTWYFRQRGAQQFTLLSGRTDEELTMSNVGEGDSGEYQCVAENMAGSVAHVVQLEVLALPAFEESIPIYLSIIAIRQSDNLDIQCKISEGNPQPEIMWHFKTSETGEFDSIDNIGEHMRIFNVQIMNSGFYKCEAINGVGTAQHVTQVIVLVNPEFEDAPAKITEKENAPVTLKCKLRKGNPRPRITWYFQASGSAEFTTLRNSGEELRLPAVQLKDSGEYRCVAENGAGRDERTMLVTVLAAPEIESTPTVMRVKENATFPILCRIRKGKPKPHVTWYFRQRGAEQFTLLSGRTDEELTMSNVGEGDSGEYQCVAENMAGRAAHVVQLEVLVKPEFEDARNITLVEHQNLPVALKCKLRKGNPRPGITWYFRASGSAEFTTLRNSGEELRLPAVQLQDSGEYRCVAENGAGRDERTMLVTVLVQPEITDTKNYIQANEDSRVTIHCRIREGNPKPHVTWYFRQRGAQQFTLLSGRTDEELTMSNVGEGDSGEYQCVAENMAGSVAHVVQLEVLALPAFEESIPIYLSIIAIRQSDNLDIQCKISEGNPQPEIMWHFKTSETGEFDSIDNIGEHMRIFNVQIMNSGFYKCEAINGVGTAQHVTQVIVLVNPEFEDAPAKITEKENAPVTLKCKLRKGNPRPRITWYFQASGSAEFTTLRNSGEELRLPAVQLQDSGEYRCVAENSAGRDERTMLVSVLGAPEIDRSTPFMMTVKENETISILCRISHGFPRPTITWWFLDANSTQYAVIPNANAEYLLIEHIQLSKAGEYKCVAQNSVGQTDKTVLVVVESPARIVFIPPNSRFYEGVEGDVVMRLPCTAVGFPKPSVSWIVDQVVVGKDKSRSLYVEDDVLYLKNPQRFNSSKYSQNISHTYVCHAMNDLGEDEQSYEVTVSEYANYEYNDTDDKYAEAKKPYDLNCPLLFTDPNSVRWFYNSIHMNKTGPSLHFDEPTQANNGNYTCRVSDLNGAASYTVELNFGYPPSASRLVYDVEWRGEEVEIICKADHTLDYGKYEWFNRGEKVKEADAQELTLNLNGWGQYVCRVTNPLGTLNITFNIHAKDCIIERDVSKTKHLPIVLDMSSTWPSFRRQRQYQIIPKSEKLTFICQDESPKNGSNLQSDSNSFMKFPNTKSIIATCDHEDLFLVDGVNYHFSELDCKDDVSSSVVPIKECLGSDTMMMSVGFNVNGFLDVYKSCLDTKRNVVLYTEVITTGAVKFGYPNEPEGPCESVAECCYESVQLVNAADVGAGPAEKATLRKTLNTVSYCKPNDENIMSWHDIEKQVRQKSYQYRLVVWSGAVNYTTVDKLLVPQYLWKVVKDLDSEEILAIVHSNEQAPKTSVCESVCQESYWFEPYGPRTYCCRIDEFKKVFNLSINF